MARAINISNACFLRPRNSISRIPTVASEHMGKDEYPKLLIDICFVILGDRGKKSHVQQERTE